jgi:hypothetical protein
MDLNFKQFGPQLASHEQAVSSGIISDSIEHINLLDAVF